VLKEVPISTEHTLSSVFQEFKNTVLLKQGDSPSMHCILFFNNVVIQNVNFFLNTYNCIIEEKSVSMLGESPCTYKNKEP